MDRYWMSSSSIMHAVTALDTASHRTCFETAGRSTPHTKVSSDKSDIFGTCPLFQCARGEAEEVPANGTPPDLQHGHHLR